MSTITTLPARPRDQWERLERLAEIMDMAGDAPDDHDVTEDESDPEQTFQTDGALFGVTMTGDDVTFSVQPLDGAHPSVLLLGYTAPEEWDLLGVVAGAWSSPFEGTIVHARVDRSKRKRSRLTHVVDRDGRALARVRIGDEPPQLTRIPGGVEDVGFIDELLRRALGLPTAPPPETTLDLWGDLWLHAVLDRNHPGGAPTDWDSIVERHAVGWAMHQSGDREVIEWVGSHLIRAGEIWAEQHDWPDVHERMRVGKGPITTPTPDIARWMDTGMLARAMLSSLPPRATLLADLADQVPSHEHTRVLDVLDGWGLSVR